MTTFAGVTMAATSLGRQPVTGKAMDSWRCLLRCDGRTMTVTFHMDPSLGGRRPAVGEVLPCLLDDVYEYRQARTYRHWARIVDMNPKARETEQAYQVAQAQAGRVVEFLGEDRYTNLTYD